MTSIYMIDDDPAVLSILEIIIEDKELGRICGTSLNAEDALEDLTFQNPDIVIVDLLMPDMDGIAFMEKARKVLPSAGYIMLSQVSSKDMIARAYDAGVEFFIQKPVNAVEVQQVIRNVSQKQQLQRTVDKVQSIFAGMSPASVSAEASSDSKIAENDRIREILRELGIAGEIGYEDIVSIVSYYCSQDEDLSNTPLREICGRLSDSPKSVEQRIRRTAAAGLSHLAHVGLEDFGNETFNEYAGRLFTFEQVRKEMDYIQGKSDQHGTVKIRKFLIALIDACR